MRAGGDRRGKEIAGEGEIGKDRRFKIQQVV